MTDEVVHGEIEAATLQQYVDTALALVDEARVHFGDHGLRISAVEASNVAMWQDLSLAPRAFEHFESPGQVTIGVPLQTIDERLDTAQAGDIVDLTVDMATRKLRLSYRTIEQSIALIDPEAIRREPDDPDLDLPNELVIEGQQYADAVAVCDQVSDALYIEGQPDDRAAAIYAEGDTDTATVTYGDAECIDADVGAAATSIFSTDFLESFASEMPGDAEVTLVWGEEFPMRVEYATADGALEARGMVAPRISSD